jgi:hypothetical protein
MLELRKAASVSGTIGVALIAVACGGGEPDLTRAELVAEGDGICREGQERYAEIQATPPANAAEAAEQTEALIGSSEEELDGLRGLEPPAELEDAYQRYLDAREEALEILERGRDAAESQDAKAYGELQAQVEKGSAERHSLAKAVGFKQCSRPEDQAGRPSSDQAKPASR